MDLTIHKNMWPGYILSILENEIINFHNGNLEVKVQLNVWESRLIKQSAPILLYKFPDGESASLSMKEFLIKQWEIDTTEFTNFSFVLQFMPKDSYIPWHDDAGFNFVSTTYLNKEWEFDWGGAFLYVNEKGENKFLYPEYNMVTRYGKESSSDEHIPHSVTKIADLPPNYYRTVLQIFWS